jgi:hypothetical protein
VLKLFLSDPESEPDLLYPDPDPARELDLNLYKIRIQFLLTIKGKFK